MQDRPAMKLKGVTAVHNLILCLGSLGMFIGGAVGCVQARGMQDVFWAVDPAHRQGLPYWVLYIFYLSKFPELIDTVILKPIIFLHWYHHAIVVLMVWGWAEARMGFAVIGLLFNTGVHIFMYWYYFASNMGWNVWFKKYITTLQICQFLGSFMISVPFIHYASKGGNYDSWFVFYASTTINVTFLCLFVQFYLKNYKKPIELSSSKNVNAKASEKVALLEQLSQSGLKSKVDQVGKSETYQRSPRKTTKQ